MSRFTRCMMSRALLGGTMPLLVLVLFAPGAAVARVAPAPARPQAPAGTAAPFAPTLLPSFSGSAVEGVIITADSLAASLQPLADFHTRTGHPTVVRTLGTIRAADPRSNDLPQAIRAFLTRARALWGTEWALMAGDHDAIPLRLARVTFAGDQDIPTDAYYSDLDGTWDTNGNGLYGEAADSLDMEPDLFVGRLAVSSKTDAAAQVAKLLRYGRTPVPAPLSKALSLAEVLFPHDWSGGFTLLDGAVQAESLEAIAPSCFAFDRYYENYTKYPGSLPETRAAALGALGRGYGLVQHVGHGSRSQISVGSELITLGDLTSVSSGDSAALWLSSNCASAAVDFDCFAEALMRKPAGGAIAYVGATRDAWAGVSEIVAKAVMSHVLPPTGNPSTIGEAVAAARSALVPDARTETGFRWGYFETILLGDPMLRLWRCAPATLAVTAPATVALGNAGFAVGVMIDGTPAESAVVVAMKAGEDYRIARTDAAGHAWIPFRPGSVGAFSLTVSARDALPFEDSLDVVAAAPAHYRLVNLQDHEQGGSADGNGLVDAGEHFGFLGTIQNSGGGASNGPVTIDVQPLTAGVAALLGTASAGSIAAGGSATIPVSLDLIAWSAPLGPRAERVRLIARDASRADTVEVGIDVATPALLLTSSLFNDASQGDGDGIPESGETVTWSWTVGNEGSGNAQGVILHAHTPAAGVTILDSTAVLGSIAPGSSGAAPPIRVALSAPPSGRLFDLHVEDTRGHAWIVAIARAAVPAAPTGLHVTESGSHEVGLAWDPSAAARLLGYLVYRALDDGSPLARIPGPPLRAIPAYVDDGLSFLTRYRYAVSAVDSSGNEGPMTSPLLTSTTPPAVSGWPVDLGGATSSNVCLGDLDGDGKPELVVGADLLYAFHADGSEVRDGDGVPATNGIFSTVLHNIPSSPAIADLDGDGTPEIIAASWDDSLVAVFHADGSVLPGWPKKGAAPFWSSPAIGDVDGDGHADIVVGSNASRLYAWHADGTEVRDGDADPSTNGVLFVPLGTVISSPSVVDLEKNGVNEIVFGTSAGRVYVMHADGVLPGWPFVASGLFSSSPAVGNVTGDGTSEIVMTSSNDSVYVLTATGLRAPGWPRPLELTPGNGRTGSAVLAPLRRSFGDMGLHVIVAGVDGTIAAFNSSGTRDPGFTALTTGAVTEATPAVADLDGDGSLEVLIGAEDRRVYAYHADGSAMSGFPIEIGAEARGTPAVWDLDGDGASDIALAGWDRKLHVWRYPGTFSELGASWPMWRHDNWHTGNATFPILTSATLPPDPQPTPGAPAARAWLAPNRPNPFNPSTTIGYVVPGTEPVFVRLVVFGVAGRRVATLVSRAVDPGYHELRWEGRDDRGASLGSGVYFLRAEIGAARLTRKMVLIR